MGSWVGGVWLWNLRWHRMIFVWEGVLMVELLVLFCEDVFGWGRLLVLEAFT